MSFFSEGRLSDSPFIEAIWRGRAGSNYSPVCPADECWNLLFLKRNEKVQVLVEGPLTKTLPKTHPEGTEWLVIKFKLGVFMPHLTVGNLIDGNAAILPKATSKSFWLNGTTWQLPDYENAETFVDWLVCHDVLTHDPVVNAALQDQPLELSSRTVRRRFLRATGLTQGTIRQIERARQAVVLLEHGVSILDVVDEVGYADQPHLTRSLKHFIGQTPAQILCMVQTA